MQLSVFTSVRQVVYLQANPSVISEGFNIF